MAHLSVNLKTRVDAELAEALERQAAQERRTVAQLVRNLLREAMVAAGRLEEDLHRG
jgi:hypothetical protein